MSELSIRHLDESGEAWNFRANMREILGRMHGPEAELAYAEMIIGMEKFWSIEQDTCEDDEYCPHYIENMRQELGLVRKPNITKR